MKTPLIEYEISNLPSLGWLTITWVGEENMYFIEMGNGTRGFVKIH